MAGKHAFIKADQIHYASYVPCGGGDKKK